MKVLREGTGQNYTANVVCTGKGIDQTGCMALLEVNADDLFAVYGGGYTESIKYCGIRCPLCKSQTCLEDEGVKVPSSIMNVIPDRREWYLKNNLSGELKK